MQHSSTQEKYIVDARGMITIDFDAGDDILRVDVGYPSWKPGTIVLVDQETKAELLDGLFEYTQTGIAPTIGSDRSKL